VTARSADLTTDSVSLAVLLLRFGSAVGPETLALFAIGPGASEDATSTVRSIEAAVVPAVRADVEVHVNVWSLAEHDHPTPAAETYVSPEGRVSVTTMGPWASEGPALETVIV